MHLSVVNPLRLAIAGLLVAVAVHVLNAWIADVPGWIHVTADDASYLRPAENWLSDGTWKDNSEGVSSFVQRPPLLGAVHGFFYFIFGAGGAAIASVVFFFLLHGLALYRLPGLLQHFVKERTAFRISWVYALTPCFWGFLNYQITEAMSASLVLLTLANCFRDDRFAVFRVIFLLGCLWFLRPVLMLLFPVCLLFFFRKRKELFSLKHWWNPAIALMVLLLVFSWEYRKAGYTGRWGNLHPIYHASNHSVFRPVHRSLTHVFQVWETRPEVFHAIVASCWSEDSSLRSLESLKAYVTERNIPLSPEALHDVLSEYHSINAELIPLMDSNRLSIETGRERRFRKQLDALAEDLRDNNLLQYHLITPARSAFEQLKKSQLNLELFQSVYRGNIVVETIRMFCMLLLGLLFLGSFAAIFSRRPELRWLSAGVLLYCFYLFYVQRMNEDRYLVPMLPMIFVCGSAWWVYLRRWLRSN
jgi:hypothetical protein